MTDKHSQQLQEELDDAALELLMQEYAEIEGAALWREYLAAQAAGQEPDALQKEDRKRSRGSGKQNRQKTFLKHFGNSLKHVAVIFLVLACLLSPLVLSVDAFKIPVLNYIVALEKKFSGFSFGSNDELSQNQQALIKLILSAPFPEGYVVSDQGIASNGKIWVHFSCDGRTVMKIMIYPSAGQINVDTEDATQVSMKIHDYEAVYLQKEGYRLMWMDAERELIFDLRAFELTEDDFWRYAYTLVEKLSQ